MCCWEHSSSSKWIFLLSSQAISGTFFGYGAIRVILDIKPAPVVARRSRGIDALMHYSWRTFIAVIRSPCRRPFSLPSFVLLLPSSYLLRGGSTTRCEAAVAAAGQEVGEGILVVCSIHDSSILVLCSIHYSSIPFLENCKGCLHFVLGHRGRNIFGKCYPPLEMFEDFRECDVFK